MSQLNYSILGYSTKERSYHFSVLTFPGSSNKSDKKVHLCCFRGVLSTDFWHYLCPESTGKLLQHSDQLHMCWKLQIRQHDKENVQTVQMSLRWDLAATIGNMWRYHNSRTLTSNSLWGVVGWDSQVVGFKINLLYNAL